MFTVKTYHSDVLKAIIPVVESLNAYGIFYFLICTFSYYANVPFINPPHLLLCTLLYIMLHKRLKITYD